MTRATTSNATAARAPVALVALAALTALPLRLPFALRPVSADEGGFLMVGAQWHPGPSLYGAYWVDRPPLLIAIFGIVAHLPDPVLALRLVGVAAVVVAALLAGRVARLLVPDTAWAPVAAAGLVVVLTSTPAFGALAEVDGELLALPLVLAAIALAAQGLRERSAPGWWVAAGAAAMAAALVKQSMLDGGLAVLVLALGAVPAGAPGRRRRVAAAGLGAVGLLAVVLAVSAWRGSSPTGLWDAVVTFRMEAGRVIAAGAPSSNTDRAHTLLRSVVLSGAVALALLPLLPGGQRPTSGVRLRLLAGVVLAWEAVGVVGGGSYWLHYLIGLVPGLVLALLTAVGRRRALPLVGAWIAIAATLAWVGFWRSAPGDADELRMRQELAAVSTPGQTGLVAFGDPALLWEARLPCPYPLLWSLPVRVRDPRLTALDRLLGSPRRPTWVVVSGEGLGTWGVDAVRAQATFDRHYREVERFGELGLYRAARSGSDQVRRSTLGS